MQVGAEAEDEGLLQKFVTYIKQQKVAVLEELASEFGLKVLDVISRVQALEQMGYISGGAARPKCPCSQAALCGHPPLQKPTRLLGAAL